MWLSTICKKNQLKRSYETQEIDETRLDINLNKTQFLNCQTHVQVGLIERRDRYKDLGVGFI